MIRFYPKFILALLLIGILAGLSGVFLTWLLHIVQHEVYGVVPREHISFRIIVEQATPWRRLVALLCCGLLAGVGWWLIRCLGAPLVTIEKAVNTSQKLPLKTTIIHALLQIITVAMGSPLGRESAPREMAAAFSERVVQCLRLTKTERHILIACGSGAGLAAVYNVPLASVVFILETLLFTWHRRTVGAALICCGVSVGISRWGLGDTVQYTLPSLQVDLNFLFWSLLAGPFLAIGAYLFERNLTIVSKVPRNGAIMILASVLCFGVIGLLAMWLPEILGNGKAGTELSFDASIGWKYALALFAGKWLSVMLATAAGDLPSF
ncbi:chloride channel protein [Snodgrassella sp. CFCC 13594]|uniref:chloride channel protein n=1 Tax=Snodgrassella sp. CFCC 13594 TaxID=1775559 RepID=UPI000834D91E|nr:chloride channel protein [Snodgrassella sp. CFCC 13594]